MQHHIVEVTQNIGGFDPQNPDPLRPQPCVPPLIMCDPFDVIMPVSINLNRQPRRSAVKIQHIWPYRMLPPELQAVRLLSQPLPERDLRRRQSAPEPSCVLNSLSPRRHRAVPLHRSLCERSPSPSLDGEDEGQAFSRSPSFLIFSCHTSGARRWTFWPSLSTATVTGMSCTSNS